jgi:hypothetical protein
LLVFFAARGPFVRYLDRSTGERSAQCRAVGVPAVVGQRRWQYDVAVSGSQVDGGRIARNVAGCEASVNGRWTLTHRR